MTVLSHLVSLGPVALLCASVCLLSRNIGGSRCFCDTELQYSSPFSLSDWS